MTGLDELTIKGLRVLIKETVEEHLEEITERIEFLESNIQETPTENPEEPDEEAIQEALEDKKRKQQVAKEHREYQDEIAQREGHAVTEEEMNKLQTGGVDKEGGRKALKKASQLAKEKRERETFDAGFDDGQVPEEQEESEEDEDLSAYEDDDDKD